MCALSFRGTFMPGQVSLAPPDEKGRYAVVLVTSRHLDLLASVVLDQLPPALGEAHPLIKYLGLQTPAGPRAG